MITLNVIIFISTNIFELMISFIFRLIINAVKLECESILGCMAKGDIIAIPASINVLVFEPSKVPIDQGLFDKTFRLGLP